VDPNPQPIAGAGHARVQLSPLDLAPFERAHVGAVRSRRQQRLVDPCQQYLLELEAFVALDRPDLDERGGDARAALSLNTVESGGAERGEQGESIPIRRGQHTDVAGVDARLDQRANVRHQRGTVRSERLERREQGRRARAGNVERSIRPPGAALVVDELVALDHLRREGRDLVGVAAVGREHESAAGDRDARLGEGVAAGVDGLLAVADEGEAVEAAIDRGSGDSARSKLGGLGATVDPCSPLILCGCIRSSSRGGRRQLAEHP